MAKKKASRAKRAGKTRTKVMRTATKELQQLRASVKALKTRLLKEAKRRQVDAKLMAAARKTRQAITQQVSKLNTDGRRLAGELKTALTNVKRHQSAWRDAQAQLKTLSAEMRRKNQELARKNAEIERLTSELVQRTSAAEAPAAPASAETALQSPLFPPEPSGWPPASGGSGTA